MLVFTFLWLIPSLLALGMLATLVVLEWKRNQFFTINEVLSIVVGVILACLPLLSIVTAAVSYILASDRHRFGHRPLIVSRHLKHEQVAARLRGER